MGPVGPLSPVGPLGPVGPLIVLATQTGLPPLIAKIWFSVPAANAAT